MFVTDDKFKGIFDRYKIIIQFMGIATITFKTSEMTQFYN